VASSLSGKGEFDEVIKDLRSGLKRTRNRPISRVFTELEVIPPSRPTSKIISSDDDDNEIDMVAMISNTATIRRSRTFSEMGNNSLKINNNDDDSKLVSRIFLNTDELISHSRHVSREFIG